MQTVNDSRTVAPALAKYVKGPLRRLITGLNRVRFPKSSRILLFIPAGPMQRRQSLQLRMFSPHAR
jgi:hypothetical protein